MNLINDCKNIDIILDNEDKFINIYADRLSSFDINIILKNNVNLNILVVGYSKDDININITANIVGNNNICNIIGRIISLNNNIKLNATVHTNKDTINNNVLEDLKGINNGGNISFLPILEIDSKEVYASHYATVGSFDEDKIFYLTSKGISLKLTKIMLEKAFINSKMPDDLKKEIYHE